MSSMANQKHVIICVPTSLNRPGVILGTLTDKCSECGQTIHVSPSTWLILQDHPDAALVCLDCRKAIPMQVNPLTPAQLEEILEVLAPETRLE